MKSNKNTNNTGDTKTSNTEHNELQDISMLDFETQLKHLEMLVDDSIDNTELDKSIANFEQGIKIAKSCMQLLNGYKGKISFLSQEADKLIEKDWDI